MLRPPSLDSEAMWPKAVGKKIIFLKLQQKKNCIYSEGFNYLEEILVCIFLGYFDYY